MTVQCHRHVEGFNSIQMYLYSTFHNTYCFKAASQKVHFRNVCRTNTVS